jgi:phosphate transport system ATP-binding protein
MTPPELNANTPTGIVENLAVSFGPKLVLRGINLICRRGQLSIILGRSGSGKTTLLRAINRLNEFYPRCRSQGRVKLLIQQQWRDIYQDKVSLPELRHRVGMVFQTPNVLPLSIEKNIALPLKLVLGLKSKEIPARVESALKETHLWEEVKDRLKAPASTLSGGQQQRLCLARVIALEPDFLLLDEPTASLDFQASIKIEELLLNLKDRYTVIAVSHSLNQAHRLADQVLVLNEGRICRTLNHGDWQQPELFLSLVEEIF